MEKATIIILVLVGIGLFFALRELFAWYYKINENLKIQYANNSLLKKILTELEAISENTKKTSSNITSEES